MNEKANVSKDLNARHKKILEGLLKLPENRECADCKSNYLTQPSSFIRAWDRLCLKHRQSSPHQGVNCINLCRLETLDLHIHPEMLFLYQPPAMAWPPTGRVNLPQGPLAALPLPLNQEKTMSFPP